MDPAKRNKIIKNILTIISVLLFFSSIGYGIYSVLKTLGVNKPICESGQTNYSEYDDNCYEECNDDEEPCPYFDYGNSVPTKINCVPKCEDDNNYDFDQEHCNNYTKCSESDQNCKYYCKPNNTNCLYPGEPKYYDDKGWDCVNAVPQFINCPKDTGSNDCQEKEILIGDTCESIINKDKPVILINNTGQYFDFNIYYQTGWHQEGEYDKTFTNDTESFVKQNGILTCESIIDKLKTSIETTGVKWDEWIGARNIAPGYHGGGMDGKKAYNSFKPTYKNFNIVIFYNFDKDKQSFIRVKEYENINDLAIYNKTYDPYTIARDGNAYDDDWKKYFNPQPDDDGFWKYTGFGLNDKDENSDLDISDKQYNLVLFTLEDDLNFYFGYINDTSIIPKTNNKYIGDGKNGFVYFGDYCKMSKDDCNKLGIPDNLTENDWNISS